MKGISVKCIAFAFLCVAIIGCQEKKTERLPLKTGKDSLSYAVGLDIGKNLKRQDVEIDPDLVAQGAKDYYTGAKAELTDSQPQTITAYYRKLRTIRHAEDLKAQAEKNSVAGRVFLGENGKKDSIVTLPSGLQYKILSKGLGQKPKLDQRVVLHFRGSLIDGTEFDNTYERGKPETFSVKGAIRGWTEALQLMSVGAKWVLYIPSDLGYGDRGAGRAIPPASTLIYELELLQIQ